MNTMTPDALSEKIVNIERLSVKMRLTVIIGFFCSTIALVISGTYWVSNKEAQDIADKKELRSLIISKFDGLNNQRKLDSLVTANRFERIEDNMSFYHPVKEKMVNERRNHRTGQITFYNAK